MELSFFGACGRGRTHWRFARLRRAQDYIVQRSVMLHTCFSSHDTCRCAVRLANVLWVSTLHMCKEFLHGYLWKYRDAYRRHGGKSDGADRCNWRTKKNTEGVMHVHYFFFYFVNIFQFSTLSEQATQIRSTLISIEAMKAYFSYVRCTAYPDVDTCHKENEEIEKTWPAYAQDYALNWIPRFFWELLGRLAAEMVEEAQHSGSTCAVPPESS